MSENKRHIPNTLRPDISETKPIKYRVWVAIPIEVEEYDDIQAEQAAIKIANIVLPFAKRKGIVHPIIKAEREQPKIIYPVEMWDTDNKKWGEV